MRNHIDQQLRRNDCGISAIKTVCNLLGVDIPRRHIADEVFVDEEGASLHHIQQFFQQHDFKTSYKLLDVNSLQESDAELKSMLPAITPVRASAGLHYVVIENIVGNKLHILDPKDAKRYKWSIAKFKKQAYFSASLLEFADLEEVLQVRIQEELQKRNIKLEKQLDRPDLIQVFNKLTYFGYIEDNYGFQSEEKGRAFLKDLLFNQELTHLPWHFESLNMQKGQIQVRAPILLSVQRLETTRNLNIAETGNLYWRLYKSIGDAKQLWLIFLTTAVFVALVGYLGVFIDQILIDHIIPTYQIDTLYLFAIGVGVFYLIDDLFYIYRKFVKIHLSNTLNRYFLSVFDDKLNQFSIRYLQSYRRGDLSERLSDSMRLKSFFVSYFSSLLVNTGIATFSLIFLFLMDWQLSMIVLFVVAVFVGLYLVLTPMIEKLERQRYAAKADFFSRFIEKIDGIQVIRSMALEHYSSRIIRSGIEDLIQISTRSKYLSLANFVVTSTLISFSKLAILVLAAREMILYNNFTLGMIITFVALSSKIFSAFESLLERNLQLQEFKVVLQRFFDFQERQTREKEEKPSAEQNRLESYKKIRQFSLETIALDNISFNYNEENHVLRNVNLKIQVGEKIWIQGKNGSGKSTLCKILTRLYEPTSGTLLVNNLSVDMYHSSKLREKMVFVSGEDLIFNETLLFNIGCGREVDFVKLIEYCKVLNFYDFVQSKTDQFNYMLHENGRNLSTGQRRKVLLLRALMSGAEVILLDEIFNGMDAKSKERAEFLIDFISDKTFVIVSHIPSDRIKFDHQYELQNGELSKI